MQKDSKSDSCREKKMQGACGGSVFHVRRSSEYVYLFVLVFLFLFVFVVVFLFVFVLAFVFIFVFCLRFCLSTSVSSRRPVRLKGAFDMQRKVMSSCLLDTFIANKKLVTVGRSRSNKKKKVESVGKSNRALGSEPVSFNDMLRYAPGRALLSCNPVDEPIGGLFVFSRAQE